MFAEERRIIVGLRSHFRPMSEGGKSGWVGSGPERDGSDRVGKKWTRGQLCVYR